MKTLVTLTFAAAFAASSVCAAVETLVSAGTVTGAGVTQDTTLVGTVYNFDGQDAIINISNDAITSAINGGSGFLTVAAWVKQSSRADNMIFSTGGQSNGFMYGINNGSLKFTTKNVADNNPGWNVAGDTWTLVAIGINLAESGNSRYYRSATDDQYYTRGLGHWNDIDPQTYAIGSGNSDDVRDCFSGSIANLVVIKSDSLLQNSEIAAYVGVQPTAVLPEPATATLFLLALAGLAARRRRKYSPG